jgi:hypothetical protein
MSRLTISAVLAGAAILTSASVKAEVWDGTAYFTYFSNQQVASVTYSYDDVAHTFTVGTPQEITALPGADGLLFAPNGNILVGGQGPAVYNVNPTTGAFTTNSIPGPGSYHEALNGTTLYTSGPYGQSNAPLISATVNAAGNLTNIQSTTVTGADTEVTQLAFANGQVFYDNSQPNCCGSVGLINLSTGVTTRLSDGTTAAHGMVLDPYTGLIDLFGGGDVATVNPLTDTVSASVNVNGANFDQGAPDGFGHALIAGSNGITFIDYRTSGSILTPDYTTFVGGFDNIDDIAPLAGPGSAAPEASTWAMLLLGFAGLGFAGRRHSSQRVAMAA